MEMISIQASDGQQIHLWRTGRGRSLILLHEWAADHNAWDRFIPALANNFTVYAWDARGHGVTGANPSPEAEPPTVERMARDLKQVIDHIGLQVPLLVGHSMGALTLWQYVSLYGCRGLGGLCIIDQSPKLVTDADWPLGIYGDFPEARNQAFLAGLTVDFGNTVLKLLADGHNPRARSQIETNSPGIRRLRERLDRLAQAPLITCWRSLAAADFGRFCQRSRCPACSSTEPRATTMAGMSQSMSSKPFLAPFSTYMKEATIRPMPASGIAFWRS